MFGLFKKRTLELNTGSGSSVVFLLHEGRLKTDTPLKINENQTAIVMVDEKITDVYEIGEFTLNAATMPKTAKILNVAKVARESGSPVKTMLCDIYVVNRDTREFIGNVSDDFTLKSAITKWAKTSVKYNVKFQITSPAKFLMQLRTDVAVVRGNSAEKLLRRYLNELLAAAFNRCAFSVKELKLNLPEIEKQVFEILAAKCEKFGVALSDFEIARSASTAETETSKNTAVAAQVTKEAPPSIHEPQPNDAAPNTKRQKQFTLTRVGNVGGGDRKIEMTIVGSRAKEAPNAPESTEAILNVDLPARLSPEQTDAGQEVRILKIKREGED